VVVGTEASAWGVTTISAEGLSRWRESYRA